MTTIRCGACEDVGQVAISFENAAAQGAPQWLLDAAKDAHPLPLILNCPKCGGGNVNVIAATSYVDFETGDHIEASEMLS